MKSLTRLDQLIVAAIVASVVGIAATLAIAPYSATRRTLAYRDLWSIRGGDVCTNNHVSGTCNTDFICPSQSPDDCDGETVTCAICDDSQDYTDGCGKITTPDVICTSYTSSVTGCGPLSLSYCEWIDDGCACVGGQASTYNCQLQELSSLESNLFTGRRVKY